MRIAIKNRKVVEAFVVLAFYHSRTLASSAAALNGMRQGGRTRAIPTRAIAGSFSRLMGRPHSE